MQAWQQQLLQPSNPEDRNRVTYGKTQRGPERGLFYWEPMVSALVELWHLAAILV